MASRVSNRVSVTNATSPWSSRRSTSAPRKPGTSRIDGNKPVSRKRSYASAFSGAVQPRQSRVITARKLSPPIVTAGWASPGGRRRPLGIAEDGAQAGGEGVRLPHAPVFAAEEPVVAAGEGGGGLPQPSGDRHCRAAGHHLPGLLADGDDDTGWRRP